MQRFAAGLLALLLGMLPAHAQQVVRVGLQDAEPSLVRQGDKLGGTLIEIWEAIAQDAGFRVEFVIRPNNNEVLALMEEGKLEAVAGSTETADTKAKYTLSTPYGRTAEALIVPKSDTTPYRTAADIKGLNFVTLRSSTYGNYLKSIGVTKFLEVETTIDCLKAVNEGQANAALFSANISGYVLKQGQFPTLQLVRSYEPGLARATVMAFPKAPVGDVLSKTNASIEKLLANGTIKQILAKYGLS